MHTISRHFILPSLSAPVDHTPLLRTLVPGPLGLSPQYTWFCSDKSLCHHSQNTKVVQNNTKIIKSRKKKLVRNKNINKGLTYKEELQKRCDRFLVAQKTKYLLRKQSIFKINSKTLQISLKSYPVANTKTKQLSQKWSAEPCFHVYSPSWSQSWFV